MTGYALQRGARGLVWVLPALLALSLSPISCKSKARAAAPDVIHVKTLRRAGQFDAALQEAEQGMQLNRDRNAERYWAFYIEKADIVYRSKGVRAAVPLLQPDPPPGREYASVRARRKLLLGWVEYLGGRHANAETLWNEGLAEAQSVRDDEQISGIEFSKAQMLAADKRFPEAEDELRDANRHAAAMHDKHLQTYGLQTLALLLIDQAHYEDAVPVLEQEYATTTSKQGDIGFSALSNLGLCFYRLGEFDRALATVKTIEDASSKGASAAIPGDAFGNLGNIYYEREDYPTATRYYLKALERSEQSGDKKLMANWLGDLARVSIITKDWSAAADYNQRALELAVTLKDTTSRLHSLTDSAQIMNGRGDLAGAVKLLREVERAKLDDATPALLAHAGLAELYSNHGQFDAADRQYQAALSIVENRRASLKRDEFRLSFLSALIRVHQDYIDFLMSQGKTQRALEIAEANRARILQERLGDADETPAFSAAAYQRLARESGYYLLSYSLGRHRSYVWVTSGSGIVSYPLPAREKIRALVERYRAFIENMFNPLDTEDRSGDELYATVLAPALEHVPARAHLAIAPDLALHALNFETLPVPTARKHYFLEDATITVVPSLNLLVAHQRAQTHTTKLLLIGNPNSIDDQFPKLPYAAKEISLVQGHFPASDVTGYQEASAVPSIYDAAPLAGFSYIHFTAHASTNSEIPLESAIILSGQNGANRLTARDVLKHPLKAELVTISACRGAGAKTYAGEGLVGFMWAFFQSGAHNIIAGLWDVSDESTPQLMDSLYAGISRGETPADALRAAKLAIMKSSAMWRLPYYWAPFQLYSREIQRPRGPLPEDL